MPIDVDKHPYLFSTTTKLADSIDNLFYERKHYVWVALYFDNLDKQAASSNPLTRATDYAKGVMTLDRHSDIILGNIAGVLNGVKYMYNSKKIDKKTRDAITAKINTASFEDFFPMVYVIDTRKVNSRIVPVEPSETARATSPEYKIFDLQDGEFELLDLSDIVKAGKKLIGERVK